MAQFLQFLFSGVTVGAIYALVALGFALIYNASHVINFAQGEFVMLGGLATFGFLGAGFPLPIAAALAILLTIVVGFALQRFAVEPARGATVVSIIIITIGASIFLRGGAQLVWGKDFHRIPAFTGEDPILIGGAALLPQSLWVIGMSAVVVVVLRWFFGSTLAGKAMLAVSHNRLAAELCGISVRRVLLLSFGLSGGLGALAGILIAPITLTSYQVGTMLGLKGFCAAIVGGLGSGPGAIVGGLVLGIAEAMSAGYISSAYKDAVAFVAILIVLIVMPGGIFGKKGTERV